MPKKKKSVENKDKENSLQIVKMKLSDIKEDERNARTHDEKNMKAIAASLESFSQYQPIIIQKSTKKIIAGNGRYRAMCALGWEKADCVFIDVTDEQAAAISIIDNRTSELASWDTGVLSEILKDLDELGFEDIDFKDVFIEDVFKDLETEIDFNIDTKEKEPLNKEYEKKVSCGDIWCLGPHRLLCGDSTNEKDIKRLLIKKPVLMVTDPPYGVNYKPEWREKLVGKAAKNLGKVENDDISDWGVVWNLFDIDVLYVWHAGVKSLFVMNSLVNNKYNIVSQIIWAKHHFTLSRGDYHYKHEPCFYAVKNGKKHNWMGRRDQTTLWEIESVNPFGGKKTEETFGHSTQKPIECMLRPILNNSRKGDIVCDPFLGSGTTLIAAEKSGRICYGVEINPEYCDMIVHRWEKETGNLAVKENEGDK